jgi:hypothetical protein
VGVITCASCGNKVNSESPGCPECGADPRTGVVARFGLYGLLGLSADPGQRVAPIATKATEETNLHPVPALISTLGMTTLASSCATASRTVTAVVRRADGANEVISELSCEARAKVIRPQNRPEKAEVISSVAIAQ